MENKNLMCHLNFVCWSFSTVVEAHVFLESSPVLGEAELTTTQPFEIEKKEIALSQSTKLYSQSNDVM